MHVQLLEGPLCIPAPQFSRGLLVSITMQIAFAAVACSAEPWPGQPTDWNGFSRYDFEVEKKAVLVVVPHQAAPGQPWVWHGEFFGHKPEPDIALLKRGFHVVYMRVPDMLGSPKAVAHWDAFYQLLTERYGLSRKAALVGLSRGGLYCYNWAAAFGSVDDVRFPDVWRTLKRPSNSEGLYFFPSIDHAHPQRRFGSFAGG